MVTTQEAHRIDATKEARARVTYILRNRRRFEHFALERGEEALGHGIVIRIADGAHGGHHAGVAASFAKGGAGVLAGFKGSSQHILAGVSVAVR